jgi:phage shock protein A
MEYELERAVSELKEGRTGLEQHRALVERVRRQVKADEKHVADLTGKIKLFLGRNERETAARLAVELKRAKESLTENIDQLGIQEQSYENNLQKVKGAGKKIEDVRRRIQQYDAHLKTSAAEAELAQLSRAFDINVTTDFGRIEHAIQDQIDRNRARARVSADMSDQGVKEIEIDQELERHQAEELLREFEVDMGLRTAETAEIDEEQKVIGPQRTTQEE